MKNQFNMNKCKHQAAAVEQMMNNAPKPPLTIRIVMHRFFKPAILWEWTDIALCFRVYKQTNFSDYHIGVDIQVLWLNIWVQCFRKTCA